MTVAVSEIISQYLDESNLGSAEYAKAYRIAIRGCRDLSWDIVGQVKTEEIVFGADRTALLPLGCVKVLDFGISDGHGGIASFDKVGIFKETTNVQEYQNYNNGNNYNTHINLTFQSSLGIGSYNSIGEYKLDTKIGQISLKPNTTGNAYLVKYLSHQTDDCEYEIDIMASEALLCYIRWKFSMVGSRNTINVQEQNKREYFREKTNAKLRIKMPTLQELNKSVRKSVKMAVKS